MRSYNNPDCHCTDVIETGRDEATSLPALVSYQLDGICRSEGFESKRYRDEATAFLKRWLTGALKGTVYRFLAVLTGVQRVSKESIFSDLDNFAVGTALDHPFAEGGNVEAPLDLSVVYGQIDSDTKAIWPQLYLAGYVTTDDVNEPNDTGLIRRLRVPNLEVAQLFRRELVARAWAAGGGRESLLGLPYGMDGYRLPRSNREVGRGRLDVVVEPDGAHETGLPAIVAGVKFERDAIKKELRDLADKALDDQALPQRYAQGLAGNGVVLWGVAFDNHKHVAVAARRINSD